jgi:glycosyltransferase involved in cell wall biosynthesis
MAFFDVPEQKILVTYQSSSLADAPRQPERELAVLDCYGLRPQGYLLFVGNIEPKKNLRTLLQAYKSMPFDQPLVVVGRKAWLWEEQLRPLQGLADMSQRIRFLDYVPEADMRALYGQATCLVFPSLYEGFGLPPLEAMALGCPVVCSKVASLPEVCGEAALYVDPLEPESMIQEIERLRKDPELRESLVKAGYRQAEKFSKENYARRLANAYRSVLEE